MRLAPIGAESEAKVELLARKVLVQPVVAGARRALAVAGAHGGAVLRIRPTTQKEAAASRIEAMVL